MKSFSNYIWMIFLFIGMSINAQITFNACNPLIENQNYTFNQSSTDATGRNVFETDPVTGDQDCGGIGVCEMQVAWNDTLSRWEIYADDGNGTFTNTYLLYYNIEGSLPNPPSLSLGAWIENIAVTASLCGGINILTGDVQDTLSRTDEEINEVVIYPNPARDKFFINNSGQSIDALTISDAEGRIIMNKFQDFEFIDVSKLSTGLYFIHLQIEDKQHIEKLIIK